MEYGVAKRFFINFFNLVLRISTVVLICTKENDQIFCIKLMLKTHPIYKRLLFGKLETESRSEEKTKMKRNGLKNSKQKPYSIHCRKKIEKFSVEFLILLLEDHLNTVESSSADEFGFFINNILENIQILLSCLDSLLVPYHLLF